MVPPLGPGAQTPSAAGLSPKTICSRRLVVTSWGISEHNSDVFLLSYYSTSSPSSSAGLRRVGGGEEEGLKWAEPQG